MSTERRSTIVLGFAVLLGVVVWISALPGWVSTSTAIWATAAIALAAFVAVKFKRHAELPGSVKLR
jgi:TRAP-type uncharacterized transport system fused permease subunit